MNDLQLPPMTTNSQHNIKIVTAPWIVPVESAVLREGGVVLKNGKILDIGKRNELITRHPEAREEKYDSVLMPGLINAHMHLELSHLKNIPAPLPAETFTDWIEALLLQRHETDFSRKEITNAFSQVLEDQFLSGVVLVADIGNEYFAELHGKREKNWPIILRMLEFLGPNEAAFRAAQISLDELSNEVCATAHAPYSTMPQLLVALKKRCNNLGQLFSVHTAETVGELEFLQRRTGCFRDFLEKRNGWDGTFFDVYDGASGTVNYYKQLGLLDEKTILVHCVHVTDEELQLVKNTKSSICLCPGSNSFLRAGVAPVTNMIDVGMLPALGTDSFASNKEIDLWREMQILSEQHPQLTADNILAMATLGGACALHHDYEFGSLRPGKSARFIHVTSRALKKCNNENELKKELVSGGRPAGISWVDTVH